MDTGPVVTDPPRRSTPAGGRLLAHPAALAAALLAAAAAVAYNQSAAHWRGNVADDHLFAYYGWRVASGAVPYVDVWDNKPPGIWWLNAAGFALCGEGCGGELLICSLALLAALAAFVGAARALYDNSLTILALVTGAVVLTHLRYECGGNRTETFVIACETLAVCGYLHWLRSGRRFALLCGALAAGAAPWFKQAGLAAAAACAFHMLWMLVWTRTSHESSSAAAELLPDTNAPRGRQFGLPNITLRAILPAIGAFLLPSIIGGAVLAAQGTLGEAWFAIARFNRAYFDVDDASWTNLGWAVRILEPAITPLLGMFCLLAGATLLAVSRTFSARGATTLPAARRPRGASVVAIWLLLSVYLALVGPGRREYHLMPALPAIGLLALYPLDRLCGTGGFWQSLAARPTYAGLVVVFLLVLSLFAADSVAVASQCWARKPAWYSLERTAPAAYERQAAALCRLTRSDEQVYVWGWSPGTYRYAYRGCPSRFATIEKVGQVGRFAQFTIDGAIADLERRPPAAFVVSVRDWEAMLQTPHSAFSLWIEERYRPVETIDGMIVMLRD